jgi:hypothetical protein
VVGGEFLRAGAADSMNIALWNGLSWSSPGGGVGRDDLAYSPVVYALATLGSDANSPGSSRLLVAGSFDVAGDVPVDPIAAWDGASWERLPARRGNGLNAPVAALTVHDADGSGPTSPSLYASGYFSKAGETAASSIARWDGRTWERLGNGLTFPSCDCTGPSARGLVSFDEDGTGPNPPVLIAVGSFVMAGPTQVNSIARWDGVEWSSLVGGLTSDVSNYVSASALVVFDDDADSDTPHKLYVGGAFTHAGHVPVNSIARWNGTTWSALGSGFSNDAFPGLPAEVRAFSVFDDDGPGPHVPALYAAGSFTRSGSTPVSRIAKWNGARWEPLGTGLGSSVTALAVFDADGVGPEPPALYAAGYFTTAGGISANHIAKWDGGTWSPLGTGLNDAALTLAVFDADGPGPLLPQLFVGGSFTEAGGARAGGLAAWDGAVWTPITTSLQGSYFGVPKVNALAAFQDVAGSEAPSLFVGGDFLTINALPSAHIARWSVTAPAGDFDCNRCLTKDEYVPWIGCLAGPGSIGPSPLCDRADSDFDGDVDLEDVGRFLNAIDGTCWNTNQVCKQKASCAP